MKTKHAVEAFADALKRAAELLDEEKPENELESKLSAYEHQFKLQEEALKHACEERDALEDARNDFAKELELANKHVAELEDSRDTFAGKANRAEFALGDVQAELKGVNRELADTGRKLAELETAHGNAQETIKELRHQAFTQEKELRASEQARNEYFAELVEKRNLVIGLEKKLEYYRTPSSPVRTPTEFALDPDEIISRVEDGEPHFTRVDVSYNTAARIITLHTFMPFNTLYSRIMLDWKENATLRKYDFPFTQLPWAIVESDALKHACHMNRAPEPNPNLEGSTQTEDANT